MHLMESNDETLDVICCVVPLVGGRTLVAQHTRCL
jgi:hypothetical protein